MRTPTLAMSTTNGTRAIVTAAERCERVVIAIAAQPRRGDRGGAAHGDDVAIFCAGVKGSFALDDSYVAGRIAELLGGDRSDAAEAAVRLGRSYGDRRGGLPRLAQRPQPDQPRPRARGGHPVLRARERARRRSAAHRDARRRRRDPARRRCHVRAAVVLFTRDLRVHDNPALARGRRGGRDRAAALRRSTTGIGATRYGAAASRRRVPRSSRSPISTPRCAVSARRSTCGAATSWPRRCAPRARSARRRSSRAPTSARTPSRARRRLAAELDLRLVDGTFVVAGGRGHADGKRPLPGLLALPPRLVAGAVRAPGADAAAIRLPAGVEPARRASRPPRRSPRRCRRRERGRRASRAPGCATHLDGYGSGGHDALAADATSRLSPYLHFGCVSPRALAVRAQEQGGEAFVRQLCWRDFYAQILFAQPRTPGRGPAATRRPLARRPRRRSRPGRRG